MGLIMTHRTANAIPEQSGKFLERQEGVRTAIRIGTPLYMVEEYLDWLDLVQAIVETTDT